MPEMTKMLLVGGEVITPLESRFTAVSIADGVVQKLGEAAADAASEQLIDASECYITPGLIDLQVNGASACNLWGDPTANEVEALCKRMLQAGVTCFLPTLITDDLAHMSKNISFLQSLGVGKQNGPIYGVRLPGLHLEGPCLSPQRPGVHPPQFLQPLQLKVLERIVNGSVRLITAAAELDPSGECLEWLKGKGIAVSLGHSNANFSEAQSAFERGIRLMTHTFNALPPLHHRAPGAVGAAMLDDRVSCCVICDGLHVDPEAVRLLLRIKGCDRIILVTDIAQIGTTDGGLVGSSIYLDEAVRNVVKWGVAPFADAVRMATFNAARAIGIETHCGLIAPNRQADLVLWDKTTLAIKKVIVAGQVVFG
jgi:N-acetylglucosamine-6-phosphate deacetylase